MTKAEELSALADGRGCLAKSQDEEPIFILCARDTFAAGMVREWADRVESTAARIGELTKDRIAKVADARRLALAMDNWPVKRLPD